MWLPLPGLTEKQHNGKLVASAALQNLNFNISIISLSSCLNVFKQMTVMHTDTKQWCTGNQGSQRTMGIKQRRLELPNFQKVATVGVKATLKATHE